MRKLAGTTLLFLAACTHHTVIPNMGMDGEPGTLQKEFEQTHPATSWTPVTQPAPQTGITEIAIEKTPCYGFCATYTLILHSNGTVDYYGQRNVSIAGRKHGHIDEHHFIRLAELATEIGYFEFSDEYRALATDQSTVYSSVVRDGTRKIICHYGPDLIGPRRLTAFENEVERVSDWVDWAK